MKAVLDTNILVSALLSADGASRAVMRMAFEGDVLPLVGNALFAEYESLIAREALFARGPFGFDKRRAFLDDFLSVCKWVDIHFKWRPNLRDEGDNHVIELALAGGAGYVVTHNTRDFAGGELTIPEVRVVEPGELLFEGRRKAWRH